MDRLAPPIEIEEPATTGEPRPRELALSAAWNAGIQRDLVTTDGRTVSVIYPGTWSHGFGPDFASAMLELPGQGLVRGDVEIHTRASDWYAHGHHLDDRYGNVVLHVVAIDDIQHTRRLDGALVPIATLQIPDQALFQIDRRLPAIWSEIGGSVCAEDLTARHPAIIRSALWQLGDERLEQRAATIEAALDAAVPPNDVLLPLVFDALGFSENRGAMRQLADLLLRYGIPDSPALLVSEQPTPRLVGVMLGLGGFLPLAPSDAHAGGILPEDQYRLEQAWAESAPAFADDFVPATAWSTARVRPANHSVYRIMQAATLLSRTGGDVATPLLQAITDQADLIAWFRDNTTRWGHPGLGGSRATATIATVAIPFAMAMARSTRDANLEDAARHTWVNLRQGASMRPAKRARAQVAGTARLTRLGERGHQGLLYLDRAYCLPRHCSRCPIAAAVVADRTAS